MSSVQFPVGLLFSVSVLSFLGFQIHPAQGADPRILWEVGKLDHDDREFALSPGDYSRFGEDGFFVVGRSDAKRDWPYVQPGPADGWAGGRPHTFSILFGLKTIPNAGECHLRLALVDSHSHAPPEVAISLNGTEVRRQLTAGAGDASVNGNPAKGKAQVVEISFPVASLKTGANELAITTLSGSWILYDSLALETPGELELRPVTGTTLSSLTSAPVLLKQGAQLLQPIEFRVRHLGEPASVAITVDGHTVTNLTLSAAVANCAIAVPAVDKEKVVEVAVQSEGRVLAKGELTLKPVRKWTVYLLPHSHVDIGYTHVQTDVEKAQWRYIEMGIEAARKSATYPEGSRFKWNTEVLWAVDSYLKQATPEKRQAFIDAVKAGWVGLDALYGNELTGLCRPEELLRLVSLGGKLAGMTGVPVQSAMITDVPGYTWGIVPTFAHAGIRYFSLGPNGGDRIGHTIAAWGDKPFWWIGPNGQDKVLVWMTGTGYYRVFRSAQALQAYLTSLETKGYPYDMVQVRHCLGDNGAPDVDFAETVRQWNETHAYPRLVIATTAEMFRDFEKRYGSALPSARGDFTPYWEDGAASSARETALNRASAERLTQAETLYAMLRPNQYPADAFWQAWRNVILYDEHTWGAHNSIRQPDEPFVKSQWAIKQAFALEADKQSRKLLANALGDSCTNTADIHAVDVFNTSSWSRTDLVVLPKELQLAGDLVKGPDQKPVPSQRLSSGELAFLAKAVPAFGALRYSFSPGAFVPGRNKAQAKGLVLTTSSLELRLDEQTGTLSSLRTKKQKGGPELAEKGLGLNGYFYLPGSDVKGVQRDTAVKISTRETGPLIASLLVESAAPGCKALAREVRVVEGLDRVELFNLVDKTAVRAKEGVHFGFGFHVPQGQLRMDAAWGVVRPDLDQIPGACKNWMAVQRWVDVSNKDFGVTWATPDAPLVEVGGLTANLIGSLNDPKVWLDHIGPSQRIYSWAMNNHWHTNYRAEQDGPTLFRYFLWPHGKYAGYEAARFGVACSQPLIAVPATGQSAPASLLGGLPDTVIATALKPSEDGKAIILRLFGMGSEPQKVKVTWSNQPRAIWQSDASERPLRKSPEFPEISPASIITLRAEPR